MPTAIKIEHHKTGVAVWHPLEEITPAGVVKFYADAEAVLQHLPRRGVPLNLSGHGSTSEPYTPKYMAKLVRKLRRDFGLPETFTLDACRHGGMNTFANAENSRTLKFSSYGFEQE